MPLYSSTEWRHWTRCHIQGIPLANPTGCYLMQLTMRKFDVKKNCLTTKNSFRVDYKNFNAANPGL